MSTDAFQLFLSSIVAISAVMAVVNLLMVRRRGMSGYVLCCAFLVLGATVYAYKVSAPLLWVEFGGGLVVILLAADVFLRAGNTPGGRS